MHRMGRDLSSVLIDVTSRYSVPIRCHLGLSRTSSNDWPSKQEMERAASYQAKEERMSRSSRSKIAVVPDPTTPISSHDSLSSSNLADRPSSNRLRASRGERW